MEFTQVLDISYEESDVNESKVEATLKVDGVSHEIKTGENRIGRDSDLCSIVLNYQSISAEHAKIEASSDGHFICDLGSRNKTRWKKKILKPFVQYNLEDGDVILFADKEATYHILTNQDAEDKNVSDLNTSCELIPETPAGPSRKLAERSLAHLDSPNTSGFGPDESFVVSSQPVSKINVLSHSQVPVSTDRSGGKAALEVSLNSVKSDADGSQASFRLLLSDSVTQNESLSKNVGVDSPTCKTSDEVRPELVNESAIDIVVNETLEENCIEGMANKDTVTTGGEAADSLTADGGLCQDTTSNAVCDVNGIRSQASNYPERAAEQESLSNTDVKQNLVTSLSVSAESTPNDSIKETETIVILPPDNDKDESRDCNTTRTSTAVEENEVNSGDLARPAMDSSIYEAETQVFTLSEDFGGHCNTKSTSPKGSEVVQDSSVNFGLDNSIYEAETQLLTGRPDSRSSDIGQHELNESLGTAQNASLYEAETQLLTERPDSRSSDHAGEDRGDVRSEKIYEAETQVFAVPETDWKKRPVRRQRGNASNESSNNVDPNVSIYEADTQLLTERPDSRSSDHEEDDVESRDINESIYEAETQIFALPESDKKEGGGRQNENLESIPENDEDETELLAVPEVRTERERLESIPEHPESVAIVDESRREESADERVTAHDVEIPGPSEGAQNEENTVGGNCHENRLGEGDGNIPTCENGDGFKGTAITTLIETKDKTSRCDTPNQDDLPSGVNADGVFAKSGNSKEESVTAPADVAEGSSATELVDFRLPELRKRTNESVKTEGAESDSDVTDEEDIFNASTQVRVQKPENTEAVLSSSSHSLSVDRQKEGSTSTAAKQRSCGSDADKEDIFSCPTQVIAPGKQMAVTEDVTEKRETSVGSGSAPNHETDKEDIFSCATQLLMPCKETKKDVEEVDRSRKDSADVSPLILPSKEEKSEEESVAGKGKTTSVVREESSDETDKEDIFSCATQVMSPKRRATASSSRQADTEQQKSSGRGGATSSENDETDEENEPNRSSRNLRVKRKVQRKAERQLKGKRKAGLAQDDAENNGNGNQTPEALVAAADSDGTDHEDIFNCATQKLMPRFNEGESNTASSDRFLKPKSRKAQGTNQGTKTTAVADEKDEDIHDCSTQIIPSRSEPVKQDDGDKQAKMDDSSDDTDAEDIFSCATQKIPSSVGKKRENKVTAVDNCEGKNDSEETDDENVFSHLKPTSTMSATDKEKDKSFVATCLTDIVMNDSSNESETLLKSYEEEVSEEAATSILPQKKPEEEDIRSGPTSEEPLEELEEGSRSGPASEKPLEELEEDSRSGPTSEESLEDPVAGRPECDVLETPKLEGVQKESTSITGIQTSPSASVSASSKLGHDISSSTRDDSVDGQSEPSKEKPVKVEDDETKDETSSHAQINDLNSAVLPNNDNIGNSSRQAPKCDSTERAGVSRMSFTFELPEDCQPNAGDVLGKAEKKGRTNRLSHKSRKDPSTSGSSKSELDVSAANDRDPRTRASSEKTAKASGEEVIQGDKENDAVVPQEEKVLNQSTDSIFDAETQPIKTDYVAGRKETVLDQSTDNIFDAETQRIQTGSVADRKETVLDQSTDNIFDAETQRIETGSVADRKETVLDQSTDNIFDAETQRIETGSVTDRKETVLNQSTDDIFDAETQIIPTETVTCQGSSGSKRDEKYESVETAVVKQDGNEPVVSEQNDVTTKATVSSDAAASSDTVKETTDLKKLQKMRPREDVYSDAISDSISNSEAVSKPPRTKRSRLSIGDTLTQKGPGNTAHKTGSVRDLRVVLERSNEASASGLAKRSELSVQTKKNDSKEGAINISDVSELCVKKTRHQLKAVSDKAETSSTSHTSSSKSEAKLSGKRPLLDTEEEPQGNEEKDLTPSSKRRKARNDNESCDSHPQGSPGSRTRKRIIADEEENVSHGLKRRKGKSESESSSKQEHSSQDSSGPSRTRRSKAPSQELVKSPSKEENSSKHKRERGRTKTCLEDEINTESSENVECTTEASSEVIESERNVLSSEESVVSLKEADESAVKSSEATNSDKRGAPAEEQESARDNSALSSRGKGRGGQPSRRSRKQSPALEVADSDHSVESGRRSRRSRKPTWKVRGGDEGLKKTLVLSYSQGNDVQAGDEAGNETGTEEAQKTGVVDPGKRGRESREQASAKRRAKVENENESTPPVDSPKMESGATLQPSPGKAVASRLSLSSHYGRREESGATSFLKSPRKTQPQENMDSASSKGQPEPNDAETESLSRSSRRTLTQENVESMSSEEQPKPDEVAPKRAETESLSRSSRRTLTQENVQSMSSEEKPKPDEVAPKRAETVSFSRSSRRTLTQENVESMSSEEKPKPDEVAPKRAETVSFSRSSRRTLTQENVESMSSEEKPKPDEVAPKRAETESFSRSSRRTLKNIESVSAEEHPKPDEDAPKRAETESFSRSSRRTQTQKNVESVSSEEQPKPDEDAPKRAETASSSRSSRRTETQKIVESVSSEEHPKRDEDAPKRAETESFSRLSRRTQTQKNVESVSSEEQPKPDEDAPKRAETASFSRSSRRTPKNSESVSSEEQPKPDEDAPKHVETASFSRSSRRTPKKSESVSSEEHPKPDEDAPRPTETASFSRSSRRTPKKSESVSSKEHPKRDEDAPKRAETESFSRSSRRTQTQKNVESVSSEEQPKPDEDAPKRAETASFSRSSRRTLKNSESVSSKEHPKPDEDAPKRTETESSSRLSRRTQTQKNVESVSSEEQPKTDGDAPKRTETESFSRSSRRTQTQKNTDSVSSEEHPKPDEDAPTRAETESFSRSSRRTQTQKNVESVSSEEQPKPDEEVPKRAETGSFSRSSRRTQRQEKAESVCSGETPEPDDASSRSSRTRTSSDAFKQPQSSREMRASSIEPTSSTNSDASLISTEDVFPDKLVRRGGRKIKGSGLSEASPFKVGANAASVSDLNVTESKDGRRRRKGAKTLGLGSSTESIASNRGGSKENVSGEFSRSFSSESGASTSTVQSPRSARRSVNIQKQTHRVLFTGYSDPELEKVVKQLGGTVVESIDTASVATTDKLRRTVKLLSMLGRGLPIVSPAWLTQSKKAGRFLDPWAFLLNDAEAEAKFCFKMEDSIKMASTTKLLDGYTIFVTKNVSPPPDSMKDIVSSCGGVLIKRAPKVWPDKSVIISCAEDASVVKKLRDHPTVVAAEWLLSGVLQQKLVADKHKLNL